MMYLETERLKLVPLTTKQMHLWLESIPHLTEEVECIYPGGMLEGDLQATVSAHLEKALADEANSQWHIFWFLLRQADKMLIGAATFTDAPNEQGEVELGYDLGKTFAGQGYDKEVVEALCQWAMAQPGVKKVLKKS